MSTPKLSFDELALNQYNAYLKVNENLRRLDALTIIIIQDKDLTTPPSHDNGKCWIVGGSATGAWSGHDDEIAQSYSDNWYFFTPTEGYIVYIIDEDLPYKYDGSAWTSDLSTRYEFVCDTQTAISSTPYNFTGSEARNSGYLVDTSAGHKTLNLDADDFDMGFTLKICKGTSDAYTVIIDSQAGNNIDGSQTYVLYKHNETVTLVKDGANTWKVVANSIRYHDSQDNIISGTATIGDVAGGDYCQIEADGTIELNGDATVWKDINLGAAQVLTPASSYPDVDEFVDEGGSDTGIETLAFAPGEMISGSFEIQHDYKKYSDFTFHVHYQIIAAPTGTDKVQWQLEYTIAQTGETLNAVTTITTEDDVDTQYQFYRADFASITGTGIDIGNQFFFRLTRISASGDEFGGDALIATVGLHYEVDTIGSRTINAK